MSHSNNKDDKIEMYKNLINVTSRTNDLLRRVIEGQHTSQDLMEECDEIASVISKLICDADRRDKKFKEMCDSIDKLLIHGLDIKEREI